MPYRLEQAGSGYYVVGPSGRHSKRPMPRRRAVQQMRALYAAESKDAGTTAGAMLHGPAGLLATPGMGGRRWGNRRKARGCTCGVNVATKEQLAPGVTRIRGNLCNVHGRYGPCDAAQSGKKPKGKKGRAAPKAKKPVKTPEQRASERQAAQAQQRDANRKSVIDQMANSDTGLAPASAQALLDFNDGKTVDPAFTKGLEQAGLVEFGKDGTPRLTAAGRMAAHAIDRGDYRGAVDAVGQGTDRRALGQERDQKRAAAEAERAKRAEAAKKKPKAGGGGGKNGGGAGSRGGATNEERAQQRKLREQERQADRARKQQEHEQDRAQRQREHEQDRAQRQRERSEDRQAQLDARRARQRPAPVPPSRTPIVTRGTPNKGTRTTGGTKPMRQTQTTTKAGDPGDYLVVEDRDKPTTWHLQVKKNGTPDHRLMGAAWAALHGGYRGNTYSGPNKGEALSKLRALYKREKMPIPSEKSFIVFKDDTDAWRWLARTTTAYRDRDGEIITTRALEDDAARMNETRQYGPLRYWHIGTPDPFHPTAPWGEGLDIGDCDYSIVIGRTSIESGTFKSASIGHAFAESADDYEMSPGFFHPPDQPDRDGEYTTIRRFERSVVPIKYGRASNLFTGLTVKEHRMDQQTYDARVKAFLEDMNAKGVPEHAAAAALAGMQQADKSATAQGIAFKSEEPPVDPWQAVIAALKAAVAPEQIAEKAPAPAMDAEDDPALGGDMGVDEEAEGEPPLDDTGGDGGEYIGDLTPSEFWDQLKGYLAELLAPQAKMEEMAKAFAAGLGEMKALYATKDASAADRLGAIETKLAQLAGDVPAAALVQEAEAALKSDGPKAPADPNAVQIPDDPNRPWAALAAHASPQLYGAAVQGYNAANGWQIGQPPMNTGGN